jgi:outer membrane protein assembly factor BamE
MKLMTAKFFHFNWSRSARLACLLVSLGVSTGCVYRIPIQQGNFLEPKDVDQVNVGMTRTQVRYLLGTPMVADPFDTSRWDYIYYLKRGRIADPTRRHFIVFFDGDKVEKIERALGHTEPTEKKVEPEKASS